MADQPRDQRRPPVLEVFLYRAGVFCGTECFAQDEILIGRDPKMDLPLLDEMVSRAHAVLNIENGRLIIQDLDSANGVQVNGQEVLHATLGVLDQVTIGTYVLRFHLYTPAVKRRSLVLAPAIAPGGDEEHTAEMLILPEMERTQESMYQLVGLADPEDVETDKIEQSWVTRRTNAPRLRLRRRSDTTAVEDEDYLRLLAS